MLFLVHLFLYLLFFYFLLGLLNRLVFCFLLLLLLSLLVFLGFLIFLLSLVLLSSLVFHFSSFLTKFLSWFTLFLCQKSIRRALKTYDTVS